MKIIKSSYQILTKLDGRSILRNIEKAGRTCYKSEDKITEESAEKFCNMIVNVKKHNSVIEHEHLSVRFIFDRGISHEMVRHRLASFSQESTRYVNYTKDKQGNEISVIDIKEHIKSLEAYEVWLEAMDAAEKYYFKLIELGERPQIARSVLPNSTKTEIVVTSNLRHWKEILTQRTSKFAHPQIREVMRPLLKELKNTIPVIFDDINYE